MIICQECLEKIESQNGKQNTTVTEFDTYALRDTSESNEEFQNNCCCSNCNHYFEEGENIFELTV